MIMETPMMHDTDLAMLEDNMLVTFDTGPDDEDSDDLFDDEDDFELDEFDSLDELDDFDDDDDYWLKIPHIWRDPLPTKQLLAKLTTNGFTEARFISRCKADMERAGRTMTNPESRTDMVSMKSAAVAG